MSYLPSKNFIILVLSIVVIGTGVFLVAGFFSEKTTFTQGDLKTASAAPTSANVNSVLPNFIESSKDGQPVEGGAANEVGYGSGNLTESLSKDLLTSLVLSGNTSIDEQGVSAALDTLFSETAQLTVLALYGEKNVVKTENTSATFKTYGNEFMATIARHSEANAANTLNSFESMLSSKNETALRALRLIAEEYRKMESAILGIKTPARLSALHVDFANTLRVIGNAVTDMGFAGEDPVRGTLGLSTYIRGLDRAWEILHQMSATFEAEKIEFGAEESGAAWRNFK